MGRIRWYRIGVVFERGGDPFTGTFHVRAFTEERARELVAGVLRQDHTVYVCQPSEPLKRVAEVEEIVARYGPYRRSWADPMLARATEPGSIVRKFRGL